MSDENDHETNRRKVLKSVAVTGTTVATGSLATQGAAAHSVSTDESDYEDRTVDELSGQERDEVLSSALDDSEVQRILDAQASEGRELERSEAKAYRTSTEDNEFVSAVLSLDTGGSGGSRRRTHGSDDADAYILWSDHDDKPTVGHYYPDGSVIEQSSEESKKVVITTVEDSGVSTEESEFGPDKNSVETEVATCTCGGNLDLGCIGQTALAVGVASDPCKACYVDPTKVSCIACASAMILAGWRLTDCCGGCWECCNFNFGINCSEYC